MPSISRSAFLLNTKSTRDECVACDRHVSEIVRGPNFARASSSITPQQNLLPFDDDEVQSHITRPADTYNIVGRTNINKHSERYHQAESRKYLVLESCGYEQLL